MAEVDDEEIAARSREAFDAACEQATQAQAATRAAPPIGRAYDAWREVMRILDPLEPEQRKRVLRAVAALMGIEL